MKQLDRFERVVDKVSERWRRHSTNGTVHLVSSGTVKNLLRREHAWMKRMVKKLDNVAYDNKTMKHEIWAGYHHACDDILHALERRGR